MPNPFMRGLANLRFFLALFGRRKEIDHFLFYNCRKLSDNQKIPIKIKGELETKFIDVMANLNCKVFAMAVLKTVIKEEENEEENDKDFLDKDDHLTWYDVTCTILPVIHNLSIKNQVTAPNRINIVVTTPPIAILVPTHKLIDERKKPKRLSHFALYQVTPPDVVKFKVELEDQFVKNRLCQLEKPVFLAVPVTKRKGEKWYAIKSTPSLLLYPFTQDSDRRAPTPEKQFGISNQFEDGRLALDTARYLGVPSHINPLAS